MADLTEKHRREKSRPRHLCIRLRPKDWEVVERLQQLHGTVSFAETIRVALRRDLRRLTTTATAS
jgi:hypothetical protein